MTQFAQYLLAENARRNDGWLSDAQDCILPAHDHEVVLFGSGSIDIAHAVSTVAFMVDNIDEDEALYRLIETTESGWIVGDISIEDCEFFFNGNVEINIEIMADVIAGNS